MFSPGCIPLSTYTIGSRSNYYRWWRVMWRRWRKTASNDDFYT
jgi:hypothetical protein